MRRTHRICVLVPGIVAMVLVTALAAVAQPQPSLAEISRREVERRKALATQARVYTNDDLKHARPLTMAAARPQAPAAGTSAEAATVAAAARNEAAVGDGLAERLVAAREALAQARAAFEQGQTRVTALTADWVAAPDEATRATIAAARDAAATEAERMRTDIDAQARALAQLEQDVLKQVRPVPPRR